MRFRIAFLLFGLIFSLLILGCQDRESSPTQSADLIGTTCSVDDLFQVEDLGVAVSREDLGLPSDRSIADSCAVELEDGRVRLYYFAQKVGISTSVSQDGIHFTPEAMGILHEGYSMPRVVRLEDGRFRMFVSDWQGVWSATSEDGVAFAFEEGLRLTTEASGFDRIGKFTIMPLAEGGYRAYLHQLSIRRPPATYPAILT